MDSKIVSGSEIVTVASIYGIPMGSQGVVMEVLPNFYGSSPGYKIRFDAGVTILAYDEFKVKE